MKRRIKLFALIAASIFFCAPVHADDDDPAAELRTFKVADGFEVKLFASEKDGVAKPIQIRFDPLGRLWVIQSTVYPQLAPGQVPNDKVLVLDPPDAQGVCPAVHVFADGLSIPTGIELGDGGAYVGVGTQLLFLKDSRGPYVSDVKADQRRVVLGGFGTGDQHQTINSFSFGPGGDLWMCQGLSIRSRVETPTGIAELNQAGLWRYRPHTQQLEGFIGSAGEPQNPWGFVFTDFGEPIVIAGNNSSTIYPVPALTARHVEQRMPLIWKEGKGRKCSGADIVGTTHFPRSWQGALIMGGYINNAVWAETISDNGAGYQLTDREPLITSTSHSFRPVDVKFGPDGSLYLCDWYNPIIGHYQASLRDPGRDKTHGRIWRITCKNRPLTSPPRLVDASTDALVANLNSTDRWTRQFTKRVLADLPSQQVIPALKKYIADQDRSALALTESLGVFQSHDVVEPDLLTRLSASSTADARAYAAGAIGTWADRLPDAVDRLAKLAMDDDPRVRLQVIVACSYVTDPRALQVALTAADRPTDPFIDYALKNTVYSLKPLWLEAMHAGTLRLNRPGQLALLIKTDGTSDVLSILREVASRTSEPGAREDLLRMLVEVGDERDLASVFDTAGATMIPRLASTFADAAALRKVQPAGYLKPRVAGMLSSTDPSLRAAGLMLAAAWKTPSAANSAIQLAGDSAQPLAVRVAAVNALPQLLSSAQARDVVDPLSYTGSSPLRVAAIGALAIVDSGRAAQRAATFLSEQQDDSNITDLLASLLKRHDVLQPLTQALTQRHPTADAARIGVRSMNAAGVENEALLAVFSEAAGFSRESRKLTEPQIADMAREVRAHGDPVRGKQIFLRKELSCSTCHAVSGIGGHIGPDLGAVGSAQTIEFIIGSIIYPNREVKEGYMSYEITLKNGDSFQAYLLHEDARELTIRDIARDRELKLPVGEIRSRQQHGSVMPNGLPDTLTQSEFRDLAAYLASLGHAGK